MGRNLGGIRLFPRPITHIEISVSIIEDNGNSTLHTMLPMTTSTDNCFKRVRNNGTAQCVRSAMASL